jgi:hypothetical protein
LFVATHADQPLVEAHDESESGQQELYLVLVGFELDGEEARLGRVSAVAVTDPSVRRSATALRGGASLLAIGAGPDTFRSTWEPSHFLDIPRPG